MERHRRRDPQNFSPLRAPPWLLIISLVFCGVLGSCCGASMEKFSRTSLCDVSCCSVLPNCENAKNVTCDCPNLKTMILEKGDIPDTARDVKIANIENITIKKHVVIGMPFLITFELSGIENIKIEQHGMDLQRESELRTVTISNGKSVEVESSAFSGVWQPHSRIRMHRIDVLKVYSNALDYQVVNQRPSVSLKYVRSLDLEPNGFSAPISHMIMHNVNMNECNTGSFGGNTLHTFLNNVSINEANKRCFHSKNTHATFSIRGLKIQQTRSHAIFGKMDEISIENSHFNNIDEKGINIHAKRMHLYHSHINTLNSNGLSALAVDIRLENDQFDNLRRNALVGLRIKRTSSVAKHLLMFKHIEIVSAWDYSLMLSNTLNRHNFQANDINVMYEKQTVCPHDKNARRIMGVHHYGRLNDAQHVMAMSLIGTNRCQNTVSEVRRQKSKKNVVRSSEPDSALRGKASNAQVAMTNDKNATDATLGNTAYTATNNGSGTGPGCELPGFLLLLCLLIPAI